MSVEDFIRKAARVLQGGAEFVQTQKEEVERQIERYKNQFDRLDDEQLIRRYKSSEGMEKRACAMLLKERGYGQKASD